MANMEAGMFDLVDFQRRLVSKGLLNRSLQDILKIEQLSHAGVKANLQQRIIARTFSLL